MMSHKCIPVHHSLLTMAIKINFVKIHDHERLSQENSPILDIIEEVNVSSEYLSKILVFPTSLSPIKSSFNRKSYVEFAITCPDHTSHANTNVRKSMRCFWRNTYFFNCTYKTHTYNVCFFFFFLSHENAFKTQSQILWILKKMQICSSECYKNDWEGTLILL